MNCYGFALGIDDSFSPNGIGFPYTSAERILNNVIIDLDNLGINYRVLDAYNSPISSNEYRIAMRVLYDDYDINPWSFHFIKQLDNGFWAQKNGTSSPSWILCAGTVDPMDLMWEPRIRAGIPVYDACRYNAIYLAIEIDE
jgi:hypothetical protein